MLCFSYPTMMPHGSCSSVSPFFSLGQLPQSDFISHNAPQSETSMLQLHCTSSHDKGETMMHHGRWSPTKAPSLVKRKGVWGTHPTTPMRHQDSISESKYFRCGLSTKKSIFCMENIEDYFLFYFYLNFQWGKHIFRPALTLKSMLAHALGMRFPAEQWGAVPPSLAQVTQAWVTLVSWIWWDWTWFSNVLSTCCYHSASL